MLPDKLTTSAVDWSAD